MSAIGTTNPTFLGNLWSVIKNDAGKVWSAFTNVVQHQAWPFVETLFSKIELDAVASLQPIAETALTEVEEDLPLLLTQGAGGFLKALNAVVAQTWQKAETALPGVAMTDVVTASHAALVNLEAKLKTAAPAATN